VVARNRLGSSVHIARLVRRQIPAIREMTNGQLDRAIALAYAASCGGAWSGLMEWSEALVREKDRRRHRKP
jgi:hypothetical protein